MLDEWSPLPASTELEVEAGGWYLYRFFTRLPCAVPGCTMRHPLYIGKSNDPLRRWLEHAPKQPWWYAQCGYEIDERVWPSDRKVRAAETAAIRAELPLGNEKGNERNEHRLMFGDRPARPVRARAAGAAVRPAAVPVRRPWTRRQRMVAGYTTFWALFAAVLWWVCAPRFPGGWAALAGSGGAVVPMLAGALHRPRRRRRRR